VLGSRFVFKFDSEVRNSKFRVREFSVWMRPASC
jgi:hypothetical protein